MPYFTTCYLNNVTMILSAAWAIPNLFPQSEPAQISSINLSCPTVSKTSHNHCIFWVTGVLWFCIVCSCFNVLMSHVQSSIELLYPINHYFCCWMRVGAMVFTHIKIGGNRLRGDAYSCLCSSESQDTLQPSSCFYCCCLMTLTYCTYM